MAGHVAGSEYSWDAGSARGIDIHAIAESHSRVFEDVHSRLYAHRNDGEITREAAPLLGDRPFDATRAFETDDLVASQELDTSIAVNLRRQRAHLRAED